MYSKGLEAHNLNLLSELGLEKQGLEESGVKVRRLEPPIRS